MEEETKSPGWAAIDGALKAVLGDRKPDEHYGTFIRYSLGGPDPLDGLSVYREPTHWLYVTYGFTELYEKESDEPESSGYGFELTFRLRHDGSEAKAPQWPLSFLQNLARYVFKTGNIFAPGDHLNLNGPIALDHPTEIRAALFAEDPQLKPTDCENGQANFVEVVGVTLSELGAVLRWNTLGVLGVMAKENPLLITDLHRRTLAGTLAFDAAVRAGRDTEGSSTGKLFVEVAKANPSANGVEVELGASAVVQFLEVLAGRIPFGKRLRLGSRESAVGFVPGDEVSWCHPDPRHPAFTEVSLPKDACRMLCGTLKPKRGKYVITPTLSFVIQPSTIRDMDGGVVEEVG